MSRWAKEFDQHPFKNTWATLIQTVESLELDDKTVSTTVEELARLQKVLTFVNDVLESADPELTPKSVLQQCEQQAAPCLQQLQAYGSNREPSHIVQANAHADNLLTYVRPYMVTPEQALHAYGKAVRKFSSRIAGYAQALQDGAKNTQTLLASAAEDAQNRQKDIEEITAKIKQLSIYVFEGSEGVDSAEKRLSNFLTTAEQVHQTVLELRDKLLTQPDSISSQIEKYHGEIKQLSIKLYDMDAEASSNHEALKRFYERIFGSTVDGREAQEGGLKRELDDRLEQLGEYENAQRVRQEALFDQIESLLPGANSAGLASAYMKLKNEFDKPIRNYTRVFHGALGFLLFTGFLVVTDKFTLWPFSIDLIKAGTWEEMIRNLLTRAPIVLPAVWLAIFSATRRSQYERLKQEYAHKEALSSSYESYKKQLQDLQTDSDALQRDLIAKAIEAIAYNASTTLDGNHREKPPVSQLLDKLSVEDFKKLLETSKEK